jgi:hypothetical protein
MRAFSNSVLSAMIVAALFWGNCFSCPQLLIALAQKASHGCCKRSAPVTRTCSTNALKNFVKADPAPATAPVAAPVDRVDFAFAPTARPVVATFDFPHSPPDLLDLTTSLRI